MKNFIAKKTATAFLYASIFLALLNGCGEMLDNPLKDKETGEDINLIVLDFNFFDTRVSVKLIDAETGSLITQPANIRFSGSNSNDIVTYAGERKSEFQTSQGQIEITVDPMVEINENNPFDFAVHVSVPGYDDLSKGMQFMSKGKKTIELKLSKTQSGSDTDLDGEIDYTDGDTAIVFSIVPGILKSAQAEELNHQIKYSITIADFLKLTDDDGQKLFATSSEVIAAYNADPQNFVTMSLNRTTAYGPEIDVINQNGTYRSVLLEKLETGTLTKLVVDGKSVASLNGAVITSSATYTGQPVPDIFGFADFGTDAWELLGTSIVHYELNFSYTLIRASAEALCPTGSSITFKSGVVSSFSIDADVYDMEGNLLTTINFKGEFPEAFVVENTPERAVKLVFRNNNPSFKPINPLVIDNFCTGSYEVEVLPAAGYTEYQIVLKALCPDNPTVAIAPTYSGEVRAVGSSNPWQGVDMKGGVVNLLGMPNQEYEIRLLWENEWEYSTYHTEFDANGNYLHSTTPDTKVTSKKLDDGRIQINIQQVFNQNVCNDMGW